METTTNLSLKKPGFDDHALVSDLNDNADILDDKIGPVGNVDLQTQISNEVTARQQADNALNINKKNVQAEVSNPTASGTATEFVSEITQNAQGVITPKRAGLPAASTSVAGLVQLNDTLTSDSTSQALTAAQGKSLNDNIAKLREGAAIVVDGDTAAVAVPVGGYAYLKNNTHGLTEGMYKNTSSAAFPVSGGTADSTVFSTVPTGAVNDAVSALNSKLSDETTARQIALALLEEIIPDTVQTITFDSFGNVQRITHIRNSTTVRTDVFTFAASAITEVRTLATGESLTIVTNTDTLETTTTYADAA